MTVGTHAFIPRPFKIGEVPMCQCCPCTASHPVHDWLATPVQSPGGDIEPYSTQPGGVNECPHGWSMRSFCQECRLEDVRIETESLELSAITPEEMVQLPNLPTADGGR